MMAIVQDRYGFADVLEVRDVDQPVVKDDEVLVRVHAAAVHPGDLIVMRGEPYIVRAVGFGLRRPKKNVPGYDVAGAVEVVGKKVTQFQPGDEVFGESKGSLAEYAVAAEEKLALKPTNLTLEQSTAVAVSGVTALRAVREQGKVRPGQHVLINGAAGGIGTFAVQIAKSLGAEVTGVCSTKNVDLVRSLGADHVIDYTQADFTKNAQSYDFILDNVANHSLSHLRRALTPSGTLIPNNGTSGGRWTGTIGRIIQANVMSLFVGQRLHPFVATVRKQDLIALKELIEAGSVTPVIDRTFPLIEAAEAIRYLEEGHARGKIIITI